MATYGFTLLIDGVSRNDEGIDAFANAVYDIAADSTVSVTRVGFDREAPTLRHAVLSAVKDIRRAAPSVTITGIELDDGRMLDELLGVEITKPALATTASTGK